MALDRDEMPVRYLVCDNPACDFGGVAELERPLSDRDMRVEGPYIGSREWVVAYRRRDGNIDIPVGDAFCMCHHRSLIVSPAGVPLYTVLPVHEAGQTNHYEYPYDAQGGAWMLERARARFAAAGLEWPAL